MACLIVVVRQGGWSDLCEAELTRFDEIGYWSELKLEIVRKYAAAYSRILSQRRNPAFHHVYIDGFSGAGTHLSRTSGGEVQGSPLIALDITPPFHEYFLIDLQGEKVDHLRSLVGERPNVHLREGDCNEILLTEVLPQIRWESYKRGLCLLDPYGLHLRWDVIAMAGKSRAIDLFLNFPIMDINRNALWTEKDKVSQASRGRMTAFWGDGSWQDVAYRPAQQGNLFGAAPPEKQGNEVIAGAFRERLKRVAGFARVAEPLPMRNSQGAIVYYLFFASQKEVADQIVTEIFNKYRTRGA